MPDDILDGSLTELAELPSTLERGLVSADGVLPVERRRAAAGRFG